MILLIDNYDSFTYNLYQYIGVFTEDITVVRNDKITVDEIREMRPERIVLSPGPKSPDEAGICMDTVREFYDKVPILGICLGHQAIVQALGGRIIHAGKICHGKQSLIRHTEDGIFTGIPSPLRVARYHSLAADPERIPNTLQVQAVADDGEIMAVRMKDYPVEGLQFHPESIITEHGKRMIDNFLNDII